MVTVLLILCLLGTLLAGCTSQQHNEPVITNPEDGATTNTDTDQENTTTATVNDKKTTTINDVTVGDTTKETSTDTKKTSTTKVKKTTTKAKKTTTKAKKTFQTYVTKSNSLLKQGKLREALTKLLDGQKETGTTAETKKEIKAYFSRVSISFTTSPASCDTARCYSKTSGADQDTKNSTFGLLLKDSQTGKEQTVMRLTMPFSTDFPLNSTSVDIQLTKNERCVFSVYLGYGSYKSFCYNIYTNKLVELGTYADWEEHDGLLVGRQFVFAVGDPFSVAVYNWNGNRQYTKKDLLDCRYTDGWLYYLIGDTNSRTTRYTVYKLRTNGANESFVGFLDTSKDSYAYFEGGKLALIYYSDGNEKSVAFSNLNKTNAAKKAKVGTMLGKTMKQVRKTYGEGEPTYHRGASGVYYDDLRVSFITNMSYDDDVVPDQAPVCSILCGGPQLLVLGNLPGAATYDELVAAIGSEVKLAKPEETYDAHDGEDLTFHFLSFTYRGQPVTIRWYDDPYTTNWDELSLHLTDSQSATVTTYYPTTTTTPGDTLAKKIFQYVQDNGLYGCDSERYEIYHEDQTIMTIQLFDDWGYYSAGIDYYKDSGTLEIYNVEGRMVDQMTFWP